MPTQDDLNLYLEALEEFHATGTNTKKCDECEQPIKFEKRTDTVIVSSCSCGKFNDTLRGL
jgi:hypothetical protein